MSTVTVLTVDGKTMLVQAESTFGRRPAQQLKTALPEFLASIRLRTP